MQYPTNKYSNFVRIWSKLTNAKQTSIFPEFELNQENKSCWNTWSPIKRQRNLYCANKVKHFCYALLIKRIILRVRTVIHYSLSSIICLTCNVPIDGTFSLQEIWAKYARTIWIYASLAYYWPDINFDILSSKMLCGALIHTQIKCAAKNEGTYEGFAHIWTWRTCPHWTEWKFPTL